MKFEQFAQLHGLIVQHVEYGKWVRVATDDHPRKKNGSYKSLGNVAWVQNFATMPEPARWTPESDADIKIDHAAMARIRDMAAKEEARHQAEAASKTEHILSETQLEAHAYLHSKGFADMQGLVYYPCEDVNLLVIPMRIGNRLTGCQLIDRFGEKKFLRGQKSMGASHVIGTRGPDIFVEGYATGLTAHTVLAALKAPCRVHVCFSAANLAKLAKAAGKGIVVADNDESGVGERAAVDSGLPYYMPKTLGQDLNDEWREAGTLKTGMALRGLIVANRLTNCN